MGTAITETPTSAPATDGSANRVDDAIGKLLRAPCLRIVAQSGGKDGAVGMCLGEMCNRLHHFISRLARPHDNLGVTGSVETIDIELGKADVANGPLRRVGRATACTAVYGSIFGAMDFHFTPIFDASGSPRVPTVDDTAAALIEELRSFGPTVVTLSGGVDSSVVLAAASRALADKVVAVTGLSAAVSEADRASARAVTESLGVAHLEVPTDEIEIEEYRENGPKRCYFCKSVLIDAARSVAAERGWESVVTGTNADDVVAGFRPGMKAAAERGARTPLADLGIGKATVRDLADLWVVPTARRPASACLSSRIAYGVPISIERLGRVGRAEALLRNRLGTSVLPGSGNLRVRDLGDSVRIEVDAEYVDKVQRSGKIAHALSDSDFEKGTMFEVRPFASGSLNNALDQSLKWA